MDKSMSVLVVVGCIGGLISLVCNMAFEWIKERRGDDTQSDLSAQKALCDERSGNILKQLEDGREDFKQIRIDIGDIKESISALVAVAEERARAFRKE